MTSKGPRGGSVAGRPGSRAQLHRALAKLGWGSRSQAWGWVTGGEVSVDGRIVRDPLAWVDLDLNKITRAGREAPARSSLVLALHKPRGFITTRSDEHGRRTVYDLMPEGLGWIFPAGRLDADSEGLLIMTNDSQLAEKLTDPIHHIPKTYRVTVRGRPSPDAVGKLCTGVQLNDGMTQPAIVVGIQGSPAGSIFKVILREGRNRQIRRMWEAVGHKVTRLVRVSIGAYSLGSLASGKIVELDGDAIRLLLED